MSPPSGAEVGELVRFDGHKPQPVDPGNRAGKAFDRVADKLAVKDDGKAYFEDTQFMTSAGPCVSSLQGSIS